MAPAGEWDLELVWEWAPAAAQAWEWAPALVRATAQVTEPVPVLVSALVPAQAVATRLPVALMIRSSEW